MHKKIRQGYDLLVFTMLSDLDSEGLAARGGVGAERARRKKGNLTSKRPTGSSHWVDRIS